MSFQLLLAIALVVLPAERLRRVTEVDYQPRDGRMLVTLWYEGCGTHPRRFMCDLSCHEAPHNPDWSLYEWTEWTEWGGDWGEHPEWFCAIGGMDVDKAQAFLGGNSE